MGNKILVLLGPLTLFWYGVDNLKKLGYDVVTHDMVENGSGLEQIFLLVEAENPNLVAIDGCFPLRVAAIGHALIERGIKCLPILEGRDWTKRYQRKKNKDGVVIEELVFRPVVDRLCSSFGKNEFFAFDGRGDIRDKLGDIQDLKAALEKILPPAIVGTGTAESHEETAD